MLDANLVKLYTSLLAVISAVSVGILQLTQASDKMTLEKVTRVTLEREILLYKTEAGIYSEKDNPRIEDANDRKKLFAQRVADIILNKFNKYYSLNPRGFPERDQDRGSHDEHEGGDKRPPPQSPSELTGVSGSPLLHYYEQKV